jgi:hypothetical protein
MKRQTICLPVIFSGMLILSCKKDSADSQTKAAVPTVLTGTWELRRQDYPQIPGVPHDYPPGNGNETIFADTTYKNFYVGYGTQSGNKYSDSGTYYIKNLPNSNPQLVFNGDSLPPRDLFLINKDTLTLFVGDVAADGDVYHYVKID